MTSPPNFMSFSALNNPSRINSPLQSPFLSAFPSSPNSPGLEPRRTRSRHMDTFSFFDAKPQSPGPLRESSGPPPHPFFNDHISSQQQIQQNHFAQPPQPQLVRWDSYQSNPGSPFPGSRMMTPGGSRPTLSRVINPACARPICADSLQQWTAQTDPFSNDLTPMASPAIMSPSLATVIGDDGDEVISTAVVVKNIPFSLKKETLLDLFVSFESFILEAPLTMKDQMSLPKPYAFNYHFDNGTFRGLAFANFHSSEETQHVIRALNGYELIGRKLRVEYKKVLPADQRERIELQKRQRTIQEEPSTSVNQSRTKPDKKLELDLNDPATLQIYSHLLLFRDDNSPSSRTQMAFPPEFSTHQRRVVHLISQKLGLEHSSRGDGEERYIVISKPENGSESSGGSQLGVSNSLNGSGLSQTPLPLPPQVSQAHPGPLRIDTKQTDPNSRRAFPHIHAPHLQPPGLKQIKSYENLRAPSPLRTSAGASGSDYFSASVTQSSSSPYASPVPNYPNPLASPGVGIVMGSLAELSMSNSMPTRQPKGPGAKNAFVRAVGKKDSDAYE